MVWGWYDALTLAMSGAQGDKSAVVRVGLIQMRSSADQIKNLEQSLERIREAASQGAQIICLQELFLSQYFCQTEDPSHFQNAEPIPGPTSKRLGEAARQHSVVLLGSIFERRTEGIYHNTAVVLDADGKLVGSYRKAHIPDDPGYYEKFYFTPGDSGFPTHQSRYGRLGVLVCWDQWFPEAARLMALGGAQILFYPTAIGRVPEDSKETAQEQRQAWQTIQRSHAIANGIFVAAANRVGREGGLDFWGSSFICDPFGKIIAEASSDKEEIIYADCDMSLISQTRQNWPFLRDRRIDTYQGITERYLDKH